MSRPSTMPSDPDRPPEVARALAWLQAEQNAAESPAYSSMLLHESAVIHEGAGDDDSAQRLYRAALSLDPAFREPLERMLAICERHGQLDELLSLYHRLLDSSDGPSERSRALIESALLELERTTDFETAKNALREAATLCPADSTPWVLLDLLGHRTNDKSLREEALVARIRLTERPAYRSLLLLDLAELRFDADDLSAAFATLDEVVGLRTAQAYPALIVATRFALKRNARTNLANALRQRIRIVSEVLEDPSLQDAFGVPADECHAETRAYLQLLLSLTLRAEGDEEAASVELERAHALLPADLVLLYLTLAETERTQDYPRLLQIGRELGARLAGAAATWCWFKLAASSLQQGDIPLAREFVQTGLRQDPSSLSLRAVEVHLALLQDDGQTLAIAIEALTDCLPDPTSKASWLLAAAGVWALRARHHVGAKSAMAQASRLGLPFDVGRQVSRLLATWSGDAAYYAESTLEALTVAHDRLERLDLGLELLRVRLAERDRTKISGAISTLCDSEDSAFIGQLARLTLMRWLHRSVDASAPSSPDAIDRDTQLPRQSPSPSSQRDAASWEYLSRHCESEELANALRCLAAVAELGSHSTELASARFEQLALQDPGNLVWAMARVTLSLLNGDSAGATRILKQTAEATADSTLRATLALHGALLATRDKCASEALDLVDIAALSHPESAQAFSRWILRPLSHDNPDVQRRILTAAEQLGHPVRRALERYGLKLLASPSADIPLPIVPPNASVEETQSKVVLGQQGAFALLELLKAADPSDTDESSCPQSLRETLGAVGTAIRYAETWCDSNSPRDDRQRLVDARHWANTDPSLLAQLEWLLVARQLGDVTDEAKAKIAVAPHLGPKEAETLQVGAQQLSYLAFDHTPHLLPTTSAAARFANLEVSAPGCDPRRRATALEEAADLQGPSSTLLMRTNLGFNWIACGDFARARRCFEELVETRPSFIPAWLGLRTIAERTQSNTLLAEACAALGDLLTNPTQASREWERAATLLLDELGDATRGKLALTRATTLDITQGTCFTRLFRLVREAGQSDELLALVDARLPHVRDDEERVLLLWERARALRAKGDRAGALQALDGVTRLAQNHVGALALAGEIHIALGQFDDAARFLAQLASLEEAPIKQRLMGALAAADLFDKKLGRPAFARDILLDLYRKGHAPANLRERLAQVAVKVESYDLAIEVLESLLPERSSQEGQVDAARLIMAICRDKLKRPERAEYAIEWLLHALPADAEAIDLVLTSCFERQKTEQWLSVAQDLLREQLGRTPLDAPMLEQLAGVASFFDDVRTRQACLGALIAISAGTPEFDAEILQLDERIERVPNIAIDEIALEAIADPEDQGPIAALFAQFAPVFAEALGPSLSALGVGKKQRVDPRIGLPLRNEVVAWAGAFGIPEFDLYITERVEGDVIAIPTERPSVIVSSSLTTPFDLRARQAVARELFALRRGTSLLRHRSTHEIAALVVAACQLGDHPLQSPAYAMKDEFQRLLSSALPRRLRKSLTELAQAIQSASYDVGDWIRSATHSLDRVSVLASGDASQVLAHLSGQRGRLSASRELRDRTGRLIAFVVSPSYLELKDTLGLIVR